MYHTNDVINGVVVHRQTGVAGFRKGLCHLFQRHIVLHRDHIHARGQDLFHFHIIKFDGAADQLAFPVGQFAVILGFTDHGHQLTLGDGVLLGAVDKVPQKALPLAEQPCQRGKHQHQQAERRRNCGGHRFRHLLGKALGGHLAKISTTTVSTMVDTVAPRSAPSILVKRMVPIEAAAMFTILLPIRMVESSLSYFQPLPAPVRQRYRRPRRGFSGGSDSGKKMRSRMRRKRRRIPPILPALPRASYCHRP